MSEDFTWHPEPSARRRSAIRVMLIIVCAGVGIAAGSYYPIKTLTTAFQRANPPRVTSKGNRPSPIAQAGPRTSSRPAAEAPPRPTTEPKPALQASGGRVVRLNPGSVQPPAAQEAQPIPTPSTETPNAEQKATPRQYLARGPRAGDRSVLVVVRRRGPPYDTKVLRGRIQNGQLIVHAPGIMLR
jgi:hypothetical protein